MSKKTEQKKEIEKAKPSRTLTPFEEMERMFDEFMPRGWTHRWGWPSWGELTRPIERFAPRVNIIDRDDEIVLEAEIPGIKREDLEISVTENAVTLKGSTHKEEKEEKGNFYRCEIARGSFSRTVTLPATIDTEKTKGAFEDGVLRLTMPKISKATRRRIPLE